MPPFEPNPPHPRDVARHVPTFGAVKRHRQSATNIWFFDSPKNGQRHTIHGDMAFMHCVLLEGTLSVQRYEPHPSPVTVLDGTVEVEVTAATYAHCVDGHSDWWDLAHVSRRTGAGDASTRLGALAAAQRGMPYRCRTAPELRKQAVLFDNWLNLCAAISRCRTMLLHREMEKVLAATAQEPTTTVGALLADADDPACMLAAIALSLQRGLAMTDLERRLFGSASILSRSAP
jgi:hypothetical protein